MTVVTLEIIHMKYTKTITKQNTCETKNKKKDDKKEKSDNILRQDHLLQKR